jgi:opacity protein-like surface antigen
MIKRLLVITLLISAFSAKSIDYNRLRFAIVAVPNLTWLNANAESIHKKGSEGGFNFGLETDYFFADNYALNTGLQMCYINSSLKYDSGSMLDDKFKFNTTDLNYFINYLKLPIGFKFLSDNIGDYNIYAQLGVQLQFKISAEGTTSGGKLTNTDKNEDEHIKSRKLNDEINPVNLSYYVGAGMEYYFVGKTAVQLGIRYEHGLVSTIISEGKEDNDSSMRSLSLVVGLVF